MRQRGGDGRLKDGPVLRLLAARHPVLERNGLHRHVQPLPLACTVQRKTQPNKCVKPMADPALQFRPSAGKVLHPRN